MSVEPEYVALASSAAAALIAAMANDGWAAIKSGVTRIWRREPRVRAAHIEAALEHDRARILPLVEPLATQFGTELVLDWQSRFSRLLSAHPEAADELAELFEINRSHVQAVQFGPVEHHGIGNVNQAGRDVYGTDSSRRKLE